jgi:hypothetical protein
VQIEIPAQQGLGGRDSITTLPFSFSPQPIRSTSTRFRTSKSCPMTSTEAKDLLSLLIDFPRTLAGKEKNEALTFLEQPPNTLIQVNQAT